MLFANLDKLNINYNKMQNFKKAELYKFKEAFNIFDIRQTGKINQEDLSAVLAMLHYSPLKKELKEKSEKFQSDNGKIKYRDFLQIAWELKSRQDKEIVLLEAFENLMEETNTYIPVERLKEILT